MNALIALLALSLSAPVSPSHTQLWITGTSNLHDWRCDARAEQLRTRIDLDTTAGLPPHAVHIVVPVRALACGNDTMDGKLRDALKEKAAPEISFELDSART